MGGHTNAIEYCLDNNVDINKTDGDGQTSLHHATYNNRLNAVRSLIDKGAYIDVEDNNGKIPLDIARERRYTGIIICLIGKMAEVLCNLGKYDEALHSYQEVFSIQKTESGFEHPDTLITYHNIAVALSNQGKHNEALPVYQKVFSVQKAKLGPEHPDTLTTCHNMSGVLNSLSRRKKALQAYKEVFCKRKVALGPEHPNTLRAHCNIIVVLYNQSKYNKALQVCELDKKEVTLDHFGLKSKEASLMVRGYLDHLKDSKNAEVVQTIKFIPPESPSHEVRDTGTRKLKFKLFLKQKIEPLLTGSNDNQQKNQALIETGGNPGSHLSGVIANKQLKKSQGF